MRKRLSTMVLAILLVLSLAGSFAVAEGNYYNEPGTLPIVNEKITLKITSPTHAATEDYNTNQMMLYIEEKTNIDMEVTTYPLGEFITKLDLLMAAGGLETGDVVAMTGTTTLDSIYYNAYGQAGFLIDTSDYLDTLAYWLPKAYEHTNRTYAQAIGDVRAADGCVYGAPMFYYEEIGGNTRDFIHIYKPWLDASGMELPTSLADYRAYLEYVRDHDMDGDGSTTNEIPATSYPASTCNINILAAFVTPFMGVSGHVEYFIDGNNDIAFTYNQDSNREALIWIKGLVDDGLLDPNSFTQDKASHDAMTNMEPNILGSYLRYYSSVSDLERRNDWVVTTSLANEEGVRINASNKKSGEGRWFITANCKYPEAAFLLGDYLISPKINVTSDRGWEGVDWVWYDDYTGDDKDSLISLTDADFSGCYVPNLTERGTVDNFKLHKWGASILTPAMDYVGTELTAPGSKYIDHQISEASAKVAAAQNTTDATTVSLAAFTEEESEILTEYWTPIKSYVEQCYVRFCLGDMSLDTEWDTYLDTLEAMQLSQVMGVWNACYDRMTAG